MWDFDESCNLGQIYCCIETINLLYLKLSLDRNPIEQSNY
jgi:hypothetical protein